MTDISRDRISNLLAQKGALGVNAIATSLNYPVSTLQRWLTAQSYFKRTADRKWALPETVEDEINSKALSILLDTAMLGLKLQATIIEDLALKVNTSLQTLETLRSNVELMKSVNPPVASPLDARFQMIIDGENKFKGAIKANKANISDPEFLKLLLNFDLVGYTLQYGSDSTDLFFEQNLAPVILGEVDPTEETWEQLRENQK